MKVFITGGAGYVGSVLSDYLVEEGYDVTVFDLCIYGKKVFSNAKKINLIQGDIRNKPLLKDSLKGQDVVIHLACISNDPSFELNPDLGKSINLDAFEPLVKIAKDLEIKRFIYASSSSVYGIKNEKNVNEKMYLEPITDYSKFKAECEKILMKYQDKNFSTVVVRPATVCGYSKRQRLDVIVNILTNLGFHKKEITIFGGEQLRPNIHIKDMARVYKLLVEAKNKDVSGEIFNAGWENLKVKDIARLVKNELSNDINLIITPTNDNRSYHISSIKIKEKLKFEMKYTILDAVKDLKDAFERKLLSDPLNNPEYFNIKKMQNIKLK